MMPRDRTAQTEPLTTGQKLVARWESQNSGWAEPADLAEAIDKAIADGMHAGWNFAMCSDVKVGHAHYEAAIAALQLEPR
jgi:hypothetical protein